MEKEILADDCSSRYMCMFYIDFGQQRHFEYDIA